MNTVHEAWYDDSHTILLVQYEPLWTWQDFRESALRAFIMIANEDHPVAIIHDNPSAPADTSISFPHLKWSREKLPKNVVITAVLIPSRGFGGNFARRMVSIFIQLYEFGAQRTFIVDTMEEALRIAAKKLMHPTP